jgi:hypothetical protein
LKSFGTSLTPEFREYYGSLEKAVYYKFISESQKDTIFKSDIAEVSEALRFHRSWDGTIAKRTDSINTMVNEPFISGRKIKLYSNYFYKAWFPTKILDMSTKVFIKTRPLLAILLLTPILIISLFAFLGLIKYYRRFFKINIVFTTLMPIFFIIATEYRRMLPALPFLFLYGMLGLIFIYKRLFNRLNEKEIEKCVFKLES